MVTATHVGRAQVIANEPELNPFLTRKEVGEYLRTTGSSGVGGELDPLNGRSRNVTISNMNTRRREAVVNFFEQFIPSQGSHEVKR